MVYPDGDSQRGSPAQRVPQALRLRVRFGAIVRRARRAPAAMSIGSTVRSRIQAAAETSACNAAPAPPRRSASGASTGRQRDPAQEQGEHAVQTRDREPPRDRHRHPRNRGEHAHRQRGQRPGLACQHPERPRRADRRRTEKLPHQPGACRGIERDEPGKERARRYRSARGRVELEVEQHRDPNRDSREEPALDCGGHGCAELPGARNQVDTQNVCPGPDRIHADDAPASALGREVARPVGWEPEIDELRRREALARELGGAERVERQHASGRLTVRERIERLLDGGSFHETGAIAGVGDLRRRRRAARLHARQRGRRPGADRRPPGRGPGRRLHRPGRRGRRRDLPQGRSTRSGWRNELRIPLVRLVDGTGRRGQRQAAGAARASPTCPRCPGGSSRSTISSSVPVVAAALGPVRGPRRGAGRRLALLSVIVRGTAQLFVAGPAGGRHGRRWARRPTRRSSAARARRPRRRGGQRGRRRGGRARAAHAASSPTCPASVWEAPPLRGRATDPAGSPRGGAASRSSRATERQPYDMRRILELVSRPRVGLRARRGASAAR